MNIAVLYSSDAQEGIISGLSSMGHNVHPYYYGSANAGVFKRIVTKIRGNALDNLRIAFNGRIMELTDSYGEGGPDIVLFIKGHRVTDEAAEALKRRGKQVYVQWTIDSLKRFPDQRSLFQIMDKVFFQDGHDADNHKNGTWLPLGFDEKIYRFNSEKSIDILLPGNVKLPFYKKRRDFFLEASALAVKGYRVCFAGSNADRELMDTFRKNGVKIIINPPLEKYADIIGISKICINIHQDDGDKAINPLFFAIPASGCFQVTDISDYLSHWLTPGVEYFPSGFADLNRTIEEILSNGKVSLERAVSDSVRERHSYKSRAEVIMKAIS